MLNPCHEVNKLLNYWKNYSRLFNKGECFISKLQLIPFKHIMISILKMEPK